ncbi:TRAP transporter small permease subunit, partial [Caldimonas tepidiphila]|uniref:TRAP transporter small permease subunit n=1 Tax=Caldimonas tepidiphila TaxID=2315841 RepID=UPI003AF34A8A
GILLVILPLCYILINLSWPVFSRAWVSGEMSQNAGGLVRWPVILLMPAGFALLALQTLSELIKRVAFLTGHRPEPFSGEAVSGPQEEAVAAEMAGQTPPKHGAGAQ